MIMLKVTIKVDRGASTFWMRGPLRANNVGTRYPILS